MHTAIYKWYFCPRKNCEVVEYDQNVYTNVYRPLEGTVSLLYVRDLCVLHDEVLCWDGKHEQTQLQYRHPVHGCWH